MSNVALPPLDQQIADLLNNPAYDELISQFKWDLMDLAIWHERGDLSDEDYRAKKEAIGQKAEKDIADMWLARKDRTEAAHE